MVVVLAQIMGRGIGGIVYARDRLQALILAKSYAERLAAHGKCGSFTFSEGGFEVTSEVLRDNQYPVFHEVKVRVISPRVTVSVRSGFFHA